MVKAKDVCAFMGPWAYLVVVQVPVLLHNVQVVVLAVMGKGSHAAHVNRNIETEVSHA